MHFFEKQHYGIDIIQIIHRFCELCDKSLRANAIKFVWQNKYGGEKIPFPLLIERVPVPPCIDIAF